MALSGGGIRSAVFSLGVLQRLARAGILRHVDYLSTVSGGGYIGSALSWWLSGHNGSTEALDLGPDTFPYGTRTPANPANTTEILTYLRQNGNYLVPGGDITLFSGIAIVLRAIFLNLLVWIPILAFGFMCVHYLDRFLDHWIGLEPLNALLARVAGAIPTLEASDAGAIPGLYAIPFLIAGLGVVLFFLSSVAFSLLSWMSFASATKPDGPRAEATDQFEAIPAARRELSFLKVTAIFAAIFVLIYLVIAKINAIGDASSGQIAGNLFADIKLFAGFVVVNLLLLINAEGLKGLNPQESIRLYLVFAGFFILWLLNGLFAWLAGWLMPGFWSDVFVIASFGCEILAIMGGAAMLFFWLALTIEHAWRDTSISLKYSGRRRFERVYGLWLPLIIVLLIVASIPFSVALISDRLNGSEGALSVLAGAATALWGHFKAHSKSGPGGSTKLVLIIGSLLLLYGVLLLSYRLAINFSATGPDVVALTALAALSAVVGWFVNINYISIHRYYRDRLMEAFLPDYRTAHDNLRRPASLADDFHLKDVGQGPCPGPYHIINTNAVLVNSKVRKFALRGGDNFILSPLYCGSRATGWQATRDFILGGMTLATAMAISGAAANPRAGVGGQGVTRNRFVSLAMTFLNLRLGYYVRRPDRKRPTRVRPNHFVPGGAYVLPWAGYTEDSTFQELSDGGHFENLALYELVRRRCGLIIICDGGQDTQASYSDFVTALQRIGQDFGATVKFDLDVHGVTSDPKHLIPRPPKDTLYPKGAEYSDKGYFLARVDYNGRGGGPWPEYGLVIYMKTAMIEPLDMVAKGYKGANPDFPDETTADQFFAEPQFEAYRSVGYAIAEQMIEELDLGTKFAGGARPALAALRTMPNGPSSGGPAQAAAPKTAAQKRSAKPATKTGTRSRKAATKPA
ncbi:hypothetical protein D1F64_09840 [Breoghania sp. L-A4]|nr:hypothetical protein D1F64_09840 [Breoghania sp. L-A4]